MGTATLRRRHSALAAGLATLAMALGFTAAPATAAPPPRDVDYVALGDSYTAGTGAGDWAWTYPCIQTVGGYVDIVDAAESVDLLDNAACHGALLGTQAQPGNVPSIADQITQLSVSGKLSSSTELVSLTAGANDVGVNVVLFTCATSTEADCRAAVSSAVAAMPSVGLGLVRALGAIHRQAPHAKIVIMGYPRLFNPTAGVPIIPIEHQQAVNQGTRLLNATIATAAATARAFHGVDVQYVDVTSRFAGHEANTGAASWIYFNPNPIVGPDGSTLTADQRNFHPNASGHAVYASALLGSVNLKQLARR